MCQRWEHDGVIMGVRPARGPDNVSKSAVRKLWNMCHESCMFFCKQESVFGMRKKVRSHHTYRLNRSSIMHISSAKQHVCLTCRNAKWRERRSRVDKDVHRTDRQQPFFSEPRSHNTKQLRNILLTYVQYNHDLGYCQVGITSCCMPLFCMHASLSLHQHALQYLMFIQNLDPSLMDPSFMFSHHLLCDSCLHILVDHGDPIRYMLG